MENTLLFKKVYGALIGSAIGDAMGGPVEGFSYEKIDKDYGHVESLLPYTEIPIAVHGPFDLCAGAYTDDSRMSKVFSSAIIKKGAVANSKDLAKEIIDYYYTADSDLKKSFMEEYYNKAIYGQNKEAFGGQPTNGAIMGITPYGVITPCNPYKAHDDAFEATFMATGYARYATAMAAAAISAAMKDDADSDTIVTDMMDAVKRHKATVEDKLWGECHMYPYVGRKPEDLVEKGVAVSKKYDDIYEMRKELYDSIVQEFFADGAESLAIAIAFFCAAKGNFEKSIIGCVNFGRDNDSSASIAGAIAGALNGIDAIPHEWVDLVEKVNEGPTFREIALSMTKIINKNHEENVKSTQMLSRLI